MVICFKNIILSFFVGLLVTMKTYRFCPDSLNKSNKDF